MRYIYLLLFVSVINAAKCQYVAIPDANFGEVLQTSGWQNCLTGSHAQGYRLDTVCAAGAGTFYININNLNTNQLIIRDLTGVEYLKKITQLDFGYQQVTFLNALPPRLQTLSGEYNPLASLPSFPSSLTTIDLNNDSLAVIPALPTGLQILYCNNNKLTSLPALNPSLQQLQCGGNSLSSLPALNDSLQRLFCSYNNLTALPTLNNQLTYINCSNNPLAGLPAMPPNLGEIECDFTNIISVPQLPASLGNMFFSNDSLLSTITNIPAHTLGIIIENDPELHCLPTIPSHYLEIFYTSGTPITCLPNYFSSDPNGVEVNSDILSLPVCNGQCGPTEIFDLAGSRAGYYPNPSNGTFTLETSELIGADFFVYDILGNILQRSKISSSSQRVILTDPAAGVYLVKITGINQPLRLAIRPE